MTTDEYFKKEIEKKEKKRGAALLLLSTRVTPTGSACVPLLLLGSYCTRLSNSCSHAASAT